MKRRKTKRTVYKSSLYLMKFSLWCSNCFLFIYFFFHYSLYLSYLLKETIPGRKYQSRMQVGNSKDFWDGREGKEVFVIVFWRKPDSSEKNEHIISPEKQNKCPQENQLRLYQVEWIPDSFHNSNVFLCHVIASNLYNYKYV